MSGNSALQIQQASKQYLSGCLLNKSLGLPSKANSAATICLEKDGILSFDPKTNAEIFKDFYSNLANNLVKKLPTPQINMEKQQSIITTKN